MTPDRRSPDPFTAALAPLLRMVGRYGLSTVVAVVLLGLLLFRWEKKLDANNEMLASHIQATKVGAYLQYVSCLQLAMLAGSPAQVCAIPESLK